MAAQPFAQIETSQKKQTHQTKSGINNRRANRAEHRKTALPVVVIAVSHVAKPAAVTERADFFVKAAAQSATVQKIKQAGQRNQQANRPRNRPAQVFAQIRQETQEKSCPENGE